MSCLSISKHHCYRLKQICCKKMATSILVQCTPWMLYYAPLNPKLPRLRNHRGRYCNKLALAAMQNLLDQFASESKITTDSVPGLAIAGTTTTAETPRKMRVMQTLPSLHSAKSDLTIRIICQQSIKLR